MRAYDLVVADRILPAGDEAGLRPDVDVPGERERDHALQGEAAQRAVRGALDDRLRRGHLSSKVRSARDRTKRIIQIGVRSEFSIHLKFRYFP